MFDLAADETIATPNEARFRLRLTADPLPVELASFGGTVSDQQVRLQWTTASETGNAGFAVQRRVSSATESGPGSSSGAAADTTWTKVGAVEGAGTTTEAVRYTFTDDGVPFTATSATYRLRQVDTDGTATLSEAITLRRGPAARVQLHPVFPNPTAGTATIRYAVPQGTDAGTSGAARLALYDVLGRRVKVLSEQVQPSTSGRGEIQLDTSGLSSGTYFVRLVAGGAALTQPVTVVR